MDVPVTSVSTSQTSFAKELADISDELQSLHRVDDEYEDPSEANSDIRMALFYERALKKIDETKKWFFLIYGFVVTGQVAHENVPVLVSFMDHVLYFFFKQNIPSVTIPFVYENDLLLEVNGFKVDENVCKTYKIRKFCIEGLVQKLQGPYEKYRGVLTSMLILQGILLDRLSDPTVQKPEIYVSLGLDIGIRRTIGYATEVVRGEPNHDMSRLLSIASENMPLVFTLCSSVKCEMSMFPEDSLIPAYIYRTKVFEEADPKYHLALLLHARASLMKKTSVISHGEAIFDPELHGVISMFECLKTAYPLVYDKLSYINETIDTLMTTIAITMGPSDISIASTLNVYVQLLTAKYCVEKVLGANGDAYAPALADVLADLFAGIVRDEKILHPFNSGTITKPMITTRAEELLELDSLLPFLYHSAVPLMKDYVPVLMELFVFSHVVLEQHMLTRTTLAKADIFMLSERLLECSKELLFKGSASAKSHIIIDLWSCYGTLKTVEETKLVVDRKSVEEISKFNKIVAVILEMELDKAEEAARIAAKKKDEWISPHMAQYLKKAKKSQAPKKKAKQKGNQRPTHRHTDLVAEKAKENIEEKPAITKEAVVEKEKQESNVPGKASQKPQSNTTSSLMPAKRSVSTTPVTKENSPPSQSYMDAIKTPEAPKPQKKAVQPAHIIAMIDVDDHELLEKHDSRDIAYAYLMVGNYIDTSYLKPLFSELSAKYADLQHIFRKSIVDFEREVKTLAVVKPLIFESVLKAANIPNFKFLSNCLKVYSKRLLVSHTYVPTVGDTRLSIAKMILSSLYETKDGKELILKHSRKFGFKEETCYTPLVPFTNVSNRSVSIPSCETISYELGVISVLEFFGTEYNAVKSGGTGSIDIWEARNKMAHRVPKTAELQIYIREVLADSELGPFLKSLID